MNTYTTRKQRGKSWIKRIFTSTDERLGLTLLGIGLVGAIARCLGHFWWLIKVVPDSNRKRSIKVLEKHAALGKSKRRRLGIRSEPCNHRLAEGVTALLQPAHLGTLFPQPFSASHFTLRCSTPLNSWFCQAVHHFYLLYEKDLQHCIPTGPPNHRPSYPSSPFCPHPARNTPRRRPRGTCIGGLNQTISDSYT